MSCLLRCNNPGDGYSQVPLDDYLDESSDLDIDVRERNVTICGKNIQCCGAESCCPFGSCLNTSPCSTKNKRYDIISVICSVAFVIIVPSISIGLGYYSLFVLKPGPVIDKSIHAFAIPNHPASLNYDAFKVAALKNVTHTMTRIPDFHTCAGLFNETGRHKQSLWSNYEGHDTLFETESMNERNKRSFHNKDSFTISHVQYHPQWKMQVVFLAVGDEEHNIFTKERLEVIHEVEKMIIQHPQYEDFCLKDVFLASVDPAVKAQNSCAPLNSLMTYFYPSEDGYGRRHYDGLGSSISDIDSALRLAFNTDHSYYFVDEKVNKTYHKSRLLRTEVQFGTPLKGYMFPSVNFEEQSEKYKKFIVTYIDTLSKASTDKVQVLFGGNELFDYQVDETFWRDVKLAYFTLGSIVLIMFLLIGSLWLTFWGVTSIVLCFPCAFFLYRYVFGIQALGILNGVAAFVVIGIGVDDVFVFVNIFRQSSGLTSLRQRIKHTMITAGKATFFTSFTTAAAFAANMASSIPAVHQFGLFMSLVVSCCWLVVVLIMPASLYLWSLTAAKCENAMANAISKVFCKASMAYRFMLPPDMSHFIRGRKSFNNGSPIRITSQDRLSAPDLAQDEDDADVPMLVMDDPMEQFFAAEYVDDENDVPLLGGDLIDLDSEKDEFYIGKFLQWFTYKWIARPVIKIKVVIIVISLVLLCVSIGLMTQLSPANKPPQIFKEDTNLQMLLNLKSNLSIDTISCYRCSGIYNVHDKHTHKFSSPVFKPSTKSSQKPRIPPITTAPVYKKTTKYPFINPSKRIPGDLPAELSPFSTKYPEATTKYPEATTKNPEAITKYPEATSTSTTQHDGSTSPSSSSSPVSKTTTPVFDACAERDCANVKDRPLLESGAVVHVVFGIKGIDRSKVPVGHVLDESRGEVEFDPKFESQFAFGSSELRDGLKTMCLICKKIANNSELVRKGSAQCFPTYMPCLYEIPECQDLQQTYEVLGGRMPARFVGGIAHNTTGLLWWSFGFESTTAKGESYFSAFKQYLKWQALIQEIKDTMLSTSPGLQTVFQTSEFWTKVLMEIVAVNSAIYGLVLSMVICLVAVALFTGHILLLFIVFISISQMILLVVGIFYMLDWKMGGVEAISLSILVGSSVDYCVHLVEGYLLAGQAIPPQQKESAKASRSWRTKAAITHIGISILSSALTTIVSAIPLTQTIIQPFAKFGQIVAINALVCIVYSMTVCPAYLALIGPGYFVPNWKSYGKSFIGTSFVIGMVTLTLYVVSTVGGIFIPGPNGDALFPK